MIKSVDQFNRELVFNEVPKRIVSLVPSQTEFLFDIGLTDEIVGITKFCIHPASKIKNKTIVGGTKNINIDKILSLNPDLIIANKEENNQSQIEALMQFAPVWISDIYTLDGAYTMMTNLGQLCNKAIESNAIVNAIKMSFEHLNISQNHKKVAYFIWRNPYMLAGTNTFIQHLLAKLGLHNICTDMKEGQRYPTINTALLAELAPEIIFLSSEPYPFKEQHIIELQDLCPNAKVQLVDGELFSWYGSRLLHSASYFEGLMKSH